MSVAPVYNSPSSLLEKRYKVKRYHPDFRFFSPQSSFHFQVSSPSLQPVLPSDFRSIILIMKLSILLSSAIFAASVLAAPRKRGLAERLQRRTATRTTPVKILHEADITNGDNVTHGSYPWLPLTLSQTVSRFARTCSPKASLPSLASLEYSWYS